MANPYIVGNIASLKPEAQDALSGRILRIRQSREVGTAHFADFFTSEVIWVTTPGVMETVSDTLYTFKTANTTYQLIKIINLVNPAEDKADVAETSSESDIPTLEVLDAKKDYKPIHYGNGYRKITFTFNREITEDEFVAYLKENNYKLHEAQGWWDDHSKLEGSGNTWTYIWVLAYTD